MIRVIDVHKYFGTLEVLKGISFEVHRGSVVSMIGASGSGKSTLLRCINYLEVPTAGDIQIDGESLGYRETNGTRRPRRLSEINRIRRELGIVFQQFNLWPHMTVLGNVIEAPQRVRGMTRKQATDLGHACLARVHLGEKSDEYPARLSGGQQQRVAIARALVQEPELILADEPIASLDPHNTKVVMDSLQRINRDFGITVLCNLHSLELARGYCGRLIGMAAGKIVFEGTPEQLTDSEARRLYGLDSDPRTDQQARPNGVAADESVLGVPAVA